MFKENTVYKNTNCLDIVFKVKKVESIQSENSDINSFKLDGIWLNRYYSLIPIIEETLIVQPENLNNWSEYKQQG